MSAAERAYLDNLSNYAEGARTSAAEILKIVFDITRPKSVIDVGCSIGTWLSVCQQMGIEDIVGVDGSYVDRDNLLISADKFLAHDLTEPIHLDRHFDLVVSLEVAEHIAAAAARTFVASLAQLGPIVLFSAAIPFQGGTGHLNEQWPEYWAGLFAEHHYLPVDCIRHRVWSNRAVQTWYAQNCLLFVAEKTLLSNEDLYRQYISHGSAALGLVHPDYWLGAADPAKIDPRSLSLAQSFDGLKFGLRRAFRSKLHWRLSRFLFGRPQ